MFSNTRLAQLLSSFPSGLFQKEVQSCSADKYAKRSTSRDVLVTLVLGHLQQASSLRSLATMSQAIDPHEYHLNSRSMPRSTFSDALEKRNPRPFQKACDHLLNCASGQQGRIAKRMVSLIDSTSITLRGPGFDEWTTPTKTRITQGLKVHTGFDPIQGAPTYISITAANVNDLTDALKMSIQPGMTYVFDKGYCDYNWWYQLHEANAFFVTRLKKNANVKSSHEHSHPSPESPVLMDEIVEFGKQHGNEKRRNAYYRTAVRRVTVKFESQEKPLILVTNDLTSSAEEIGALYKQRWQIELFFKWIKQHLKLKRFYAFSENAVLLQLYSAVITYLLLHLFHRRSACSGTLFDLTLQLTCVLFERPLAQEHHARRRRETEKLKAAQGSLQL
jgi:hypothetical protein